MLLLSDFFIVAGFAINYLFPIRSIGGLKGIGAVLIHTFSGIELHRVSLFNSFLMSTIGTETG